MSQKRKPRRQDARPAAEQAPPLPRATLRGEHRFLDGLVIATAVLAAAGWAYNLYSRVSVEPEAARLLEEARQALPDGRDPAIEAWQLLRSAHVFGKIEEGPAPIPADEPVAGALDEPALLGGTAPARVDEALAAVQHEGRDSDQLRAVLMGTAEPAGPDDLSAIRRAHPAFARMVALEEKGSDGDPLRGEAAESCRRYPPCLSTYVRLRLPALHAYLELRRRSAEGQALPAAEVQALTRRPSAFLRAFRLDKVEAGQPITSSDLDLLRVLLEVRRNASRNGLLFSGFLTAVLAVLVATRLLSPRFAGREAAGAREA